MSTSFTPRLHSMAIMLVLGAPAIAEEVTLPGITVNASGESMETFNSPVQEYVARRSATATKTDTSIVEIPQSISVVGAEQMQATNSRTLLDAFRYTAGVTNGIGFNPEIETYVLRGFRQWGGPLRDGLQYTGEFTGFQEVYGLERLEVLKGAASVLYGAQSPGGVVNGVSKRPSAEQEQELGIELGNFRYKQVTADLGGKLDADGRLLWRLTALGRDAQTQVDDTVNDRVYIAPALLWQPQAGSQIGVQLMYQNSHQTNLGGLPYQGTIHDNPYGKFSRHTNVGEPGQDGTRNKDVALTVDYRHEFNATWASSGILRWGRQQTDVNYTGILALNDDQRTGLRYAARDYKTDARYLTGDVRLEAKLAQGPLVHKVLAGADFKSTREGTANDAGMWSAWPWIGADIDMFDPVHGAQPDRSDNSATIYFPSRKAKGEQGLYLQDQLALGEHWRLLLGGRYSWVSQEDRLSGQRQSDGKFTGNAGVVYLAPYGLAPYVSFSQSFQQEVGQRFDGGLFKPTEGEQVELGVRWQPAGEAGPRYSLAVYQLTRTNVAKTDPLHPDFQIQVGAARSRGLELEAQGKFNRYVAGTLAYAYTDSRVTKSTDPQEIGARVHGVPFHQASAWLDLLGDAFGLARWTLGLGVRYVGEKSIDGETFNLPSSTQFDARLAYAYKQWQFDLKGTNLTDRVDFGDCGWGRCQFNQARTVTASMRYRF